MPKLPAPPSCRRERSRGQSFVEFALILPILLLLTLITIDFGRVFLGWINLQNMARIAANYAANNPEAWGTPGDATKQARYLEIVSNDAKAINCSVSGTGGGGLRPPVFSNGTDLGDLVEVNLGCRFTIITPIISQVVGGTVGLEASAVSPIRSGTVPGVPGGGGGPLVQAPEARFAASPQSGYAPLTVQFTDTSIRGPTSWTWDFGDGISYERDPVHTYTTPGRYSVGLTVQNSGGFDSETKVDHIVVVDPPTAGPIPGFTATPRSGNSPLSVSFTDQSVGTVTTRTWNFGDSSPTSSQTNPSHSYAATGAYTVTLTVSDGTTTNTLAKVAYVLVNELPCRVPNFFNTKKNAAQATWAAAGFTTQVQMAPGGNYTIKTQSLAAGSVPDLECGASITVGP